MNVALKILFSFLMCNVYILSMTQHTVNHGIIDNVDLMRHQSTIKRMNL